MTELAPAPQALSEKDIIDRYGPALTRMIRTEIDADVEHERVVQVMEALRNILYWDGKQYVVPDIDTATGIITVKPITDDSGQDKFASVYNVYLADGLKFVGAVGSRAPNCKALPDDDQTEEFVQRATEADATLRDLFREWDADAKQKVLAQNAWNTGATFLYTPFVSDGHRYGTEEVPQIELVEQEDEFGEMLPVPQVTGTKKYPNGDVQLYLLDCRYVTIPYKAKDLPDCEYLCYEYQEHKAILKAMYGDRLKDAEWASEDNANAGQDRALEAQERAVSPSGRPFDNWKSSRWRYTRHWLRPVYYSLIEGEAKDTEGFKLLGEDGKPMPIARQLEEQFPEGLKITLVNGRIVDVEHERMDDVWAVCKPGTGERILSKPWGNASIPIQDDLNDFVNMLRENVLRHNVRVAVDSQLFDMEKLREQDNKVVEFIPFRAQTGTDIDKLMKAIPTASMPNDAVALVQLICMTLRREISGVTESLAGIGAPAPTYRAEKQRRDQSMMQFSPFFTEAQSAWEKAALNGIRQRARYSSRILKVAGEDGDGSIEVDLALLQEGGWHIEAEEGIPMSYAEEADAARYLVSTEANPEVAANMGIWEPWNRPMLARKLGLRGISSGIENDQKKVHDIIRTLLRTPMPPAEVDEMGMPMPPQPSIMPEKGIEDHALYSDLVRYWCNSPMGQRQKKTNPDGYAHVVAYFEAQKALADAMAAPLPQPEGGAGPEAAPPSQEPMPAPGGPMPPAPGEMPPAGDQPFNTAPPQF